MSVWKVTIVLVGAWLALAASMACTVQFDGPNPRLVNLTSLQAR